VYLAHLSMGWIEKWHLSVKVLYGWHVDCFKLCRPRLLVYFRSEYAEKGLVRERE
jgi:hypothetical protein